MSDELGDESLRETRLTAIRENLEWLEEHDLDEESDMAAKRLGLIQGDAMALVRLLNNDEKPVVESRVVRDEDAPEGGFWRLFR